MNYFDILLAKKLSGGSPTPPGDTYERKSVTSYPVTGPANYPLPKCDVTVTDADKCEVIVTTDNTITEDSGVYIERQSGGGSRELDEIVGGSVVWNQLVPIPTNDISTSSSGIVFVDNRDGSYTLSTNSGGATSTTNINIDTMNIPKGHKIYLTGSYTNTSATTHRWIFISSGSNTYFDRGDGVYTIADDTTSFRLQVINGDEITTAETKRPNIIDLTALFGTTIADYIYSLEQATAGSGIAWLRSYGYLTEDYYGYTANKIESVSVARHVMKDSNDSVIGSYAINPITLRGIPKLNASNQLYYDGDRYEASGRVTRRYGIVDMGTLTWEKINAIFRTNGPLQNAKTPSSVSVVPNICTSIHTPVAYENLTGTDKAVTIIMENSFYKGELWVHDETYNDAATFKTAMSGVYLVYELATPTTESTSPFEANQIVDANGTEEYIDAGVEAGTRDVAIPVGHDTKYYNGKAYVKPLTAGTSDTVSMADMGIMPTSPMYISANGEIDAEYWKQVE